MKGETLSITSQPCGGATAPAMLNVSRPDAHGHPNALMYEPFTKFASYVDTSSARPHPVQDAGKPVLLDGQDSLGYEDAMNPGRFILGQTYLNDFFEGEHEQLEDDYPMTLAISEPIYAEQ